MINEDVRCCKKCLCIGFWLASKAFVSRKMVYTSASRKGHVKRLSNKLIITFYRNVVNVLSGKCLVLPSLSHKTINSFTFSGSRGTNRM